MQWYIVTPRNDQLLDDAMLTNLFIPGWWVHAFDYAATSRESPTTQSWQMGLTPALSTHELSALTTILGALQKQILESKSQAAFSLAPHVFQKHATTTSRLKLDSYTRVLQGVAGLRILARDERGFQALPLLQEERWTKVDDQFRLEFELTDLAYDLILGYANPYHELIRRAKQQTESMAVLGSSAPLCLWRSAWIELQGVEQALLLRLERAMQWEGAWLHFDGVFGKSVDQLCDGLDLNPAASVASRLEAVAKAFDKLGKKLCHQGLLSFQVDHDYLAFGEGHEPLLQIVWQISKQRLLMEEGDLYQARCVEFLSQRFLRRHHDLFAQILQLEARVCREASGRLARVVVQEQLGLPLFGESSAAPLTSLMLFLDWSARRQPEHRLPLPEAIAQSSAGQLTGLHSEELEDRFQQFHRLLTTSVDYRDVLENERLSYLAHPELAGDAALLELLAASAGQPQPMTLVKDDTEKDTPAPVTDKSKPSLSMKKLASDELDHLQKSSPSEYTNLKQRYLESLEPTRRKLYMEMRGKMQPDIFDKNLRPSLVKYMLENPAVWTGSSKRQTTGGFWPPVSR